MNTPLAIIFSLAISNLITFAENRTFESNDGRKLKGKITNTANNIAEFQRSDGKIFSIPFDKFSSEDQSYLQTWKPPAPDQETPLNKAIGQPLFFSETSNSIFTKQASHIASHLGIPPESSSKYSSSWRLYSVLSEKPYFFFGSKPSTISLYAGENGNLESISAIYTNKGDYGSNFGFAEDHQKGEITKKKKSLNEAMLEDKELIQQNITNVLGEGKEQRFGEGKARRDVIRWDRGDQSIILSLEKSEYVGISIIPKALADKKGRTEWIRDDELKKRNTSLVARSDNGDVIITEIPMVDQGPKGYCVPATFERVMRHMGMSADMYVLAMVGGTSRGGGTNVNELVESIRSQIYAKGRRAKDIEIKELQLSSVQNYIDEGIPVMWRMYSTRLYNTIANQRTKDRQQVTDWDKWASIINKQTRKSLPNLRKDPEGPHICMIIGYNEQTQEFAVSDSWGPSYKTRWVTIQEANAVTNGDLLVIVP